MEETKKQHILFISILFVVALIVFYPWLNAYSYPWGEHISTYLPRATILRNAIAQYKDFLPLWSPFTMGGTPYFAKSDTVTIGHPLYLLILLFEPAAAIKLNYLLNVFLAGLFMYLLCITLKVKPKFSFIAAFLFITNGFLIKIFGWGWQTTLDAYALMPLVLLFAVKAVKTKDWLFYAILTGITMAVQIYGGPDLKVFLFTAVMFGFYLIFSLVGSNLMRRLVKAILIGIITILVVFGATAIKTLPAKEYIEMSSRSHLSWEDASKRPLLAKEMFHRLIDPVRFKELDLPFTKDKSPTDKLGIVAFALALFGIFSKYKNKFVLFLAATVIFAILFANASFVFYFLWKYIPPWDSFRYADRALVLYVFAGSLLAALGASALFEKIETKVKKKTAVIAYVSLVVLLFLNLVVFGYTTIGFATQQRNIKEVIASHDILDYISRQPGIFRMHNFETRGIDWGTELYNIPYKLQSLYGYESAWIVDYMNIYLSVAYGNLPKFWGILNVRYITSQEPLNMSGFRFVKKFENCTICYPEISAIQKSWGPYLYENELAMPRAYVVDNAFLIIGNEQNAKQTMYGLMSHADFNPRKHVIVLAKKPSVNDYGFDYLRRFKAIILTEGSVDQRSGLVLKQYADSGGMVLPNILQNIGTITGKDIENLFALEGNYFPVKDEDIAYDSFDRFEIKNAPKGFLVLSELFSLYPGWQASVQDEQQEIMRANGVISAIPLDEAGNISFTYKPSSYTKGKIATIITMLLVLAYLSFKVWKTIGKKFHLPNEDTSTK